MEDQSQKMLRRRKPFRLLGKMDKSEIAQFRLFLTWPIANAKPDLKLIEFFDHCEKIALWNRDIDKAAFEKITKWVMTDNAFDKLVSRLYNQLALFAATTEFLDTPAQHAPFAVKYYEKRGLEQGEIGKKVKEGKRELSGSEQNEDYYRMMLELDLEAAELSKSRTQTPEERGLVGLHSHLDSYYFILKLRFLCASANEQRIYGDAAAVMPDEWMLKWLQAMYPFMPALARVYFHAYHILRGIDDTLHLDAFQLQLKDWNAQSQESSTTQFADLNGYLLNYYLRKLNTGDMEALPQAHHFYLEALHQQWLFEGGKLYHEHFKNLLMIKCRLNLMSDARLFHESYKNALTDNLGGAVLDYTEAVIAFYEKQFATAISKLETLMEAKGSIKTDQFYGLDMRILLLKAYFESLRTADPKTWDIVDEKLRSLLHAFPAYIARRNLQRTKQLRYDNFRNMLHRLLVTTYDLPENENKTKMKELLMDLRSSSNLLDRNWLIIKATEITG